MTPYDPRPVSQGGNRGAGEEFQLCAPKGQYRVVGVDTFDGTDWVKGDYDSLDEAKAVARAGAGEMCRQYIYDDQGRRLGATGTF